jgi:3-oxoadipate enol-lactonase
MKFAIVGDITLHYSLEGVTDGVPLVLINSLGTDLRLWDRLVPHFDHRFALIRYDKRGHGLSDCPPGPYSIQDQANDLAGLLEYLQLKQVILIGISVGGMIALAYAGRDPDRVKALVLADTAAKIGVPEFWDERIKAIQTNGLAGMAETILARWFSPAFPAQRPADYRGYANMLTRTPAAGYIATCQALQAADLSPLAATIQTPALVLCGAEDLATPPERSRELAAALRNARFELIEQAGHLPCVEQPAAMAEKITRFLQELLDQ